MPVESNAFLFLFVNTGYGVAVEVERLYPNLSVEKKKQLVERLSHVVFFGIVSDTLCEPDLSAENEVCMTNEFAGRLHDTIIDIVELNTSSNINIIIFKHKTHVYIHGLA